MPTCIAPMHTNGVSRSKDARRGFTFTELIIVILMISLFVLMTQMRLFGLFRKNTFKAHVQQLVSTMQTAVSAAAESDRRYEVIIDLVEQSYMLRQISSADLSEVLEEEIIAINDFGDSCRLAYVLFDDGEFTNEGRAKFRAGHSGWQYGGVIVLLDEDENPYSVLVNRLNRIVTLSRGEIEPPEAKRADEVPF